MNKINVTRKLPTEVAYQFDGTLEGAKKLIKELLNKYDSDPHIVMYPEDDNIYILVEGRTIKKNQWIIFFISPVTLNNEMMIFDAVDFWNKFEEVKG